MAFHLTASMVRSFRKRELIEAYQRGDHTGCYWGIRTNYSDYKLMDDPLKCKLAGNRDASNPQPRPGSKIAIAELANVESGKRDVVSS